MIFTVEEICAITGMEFKGPENMRNYPLSCPLTDSRSLTEPEKTVFFALRTSSGDGHNYIRHLYNRGVRVFVTDSRRNVTLPDDAVVISVDNPLEALQKTGKSIRSRMDCPIVGITGSYGKTVVKEMLNALLEGRFDIARSPRSWNSQIGVPLSMWQVNDNTDLGIFEAGISHSGEMTALQDIINPTVGVFTGLSDEHERGFSGIREKILEKALLFKNCRTIIYNDDKLLVGEVLHEMYPDRQLIAVDGNREICAEVTGCLGLNREEALRALDDISEVSSRIDITDSPEGFIVAFDRFTCDAQSIGTALDTVRRRKADGMSLAAFLGDLQCPPEAEEAEYEALLTTLKDYGVEDVITAGKKISTYLRDNGEGLTIRHYDSPAEAIDSVSLSYFYNKVLYINGTDKEEFGQVYSWLNSRRNVTQLEINLDALARNYHHYRSILPSETGIIGMVKASAYGCGALEVARTLQSQGADMVAVAVVDEGVSLRKGGVTLPVIVLDPWCENMRAIFAYNLEPTIIAPDEKILCLLEDAATSQGMDEIRVHVKIDSGMHRVGLSEDELEEFVRTLERHPRIKVQSVFSHLATADCLDMDAYTEGQLTLFERMSSYLVSHIPYPIRRHVLNTAGISRYGKTHCYELARLGIGLYGITPLDAADRAHLRPVARLVTQIIATRKYEPGTTVGYGCHGHLDRPSVVGTIPIGYADGIDRRLGNGHASFMVNGTLCPTVGNICMDLCMIDLTDCKDIGNGRVEIFGPEVPIERLSDTLGTIPYEIIARVSPRVKRVYYRE